MSEYHCQDCGFIHCICEQKYMSNTFKKALEKISFYYAIPIEELIKVIGYNL